jgi:hypothetical protein
MTQEEPGFPVYLTKGRVAYVSECDIAWVRKFRWRYNGDGSMYAVRSYRREDGTKTNKYLHREIMQAPTGMVVNHLDGDTLNCRRGNMHLATHRANTTVLRVDKGLVKFAGVDRRSPNLADDVGRKPYRARITTVAGRVLLGQFATAEEAAKAYDRAAVNLYGLAADTNFPLTNYVCPGILEWGAPQNEVVYRTQGDVPF